MTPTKPVPIVLSLSVLAALLWDTGSAQRSLPIGEIGNGPAPGQGTNILPEDVALPSLPAAPAPN